MHRLIAVAAVIAGRVGVGRDVGVGVRVGVGRGIAVVDCIGVRGFIGVEGCVRVPNKRHTCIDMVRPVAVVCEVVVRAGGRGRAAYLKCSNS